MQSQPTGLPLFYQKPMPLTPARHGGLSLQREPDYSFARPVNALPLNVVEFATACHDYPIVFAQGAAEPMPLVVVGVRAQRNLFVDEQGGWRAGCYVPAYLRRFPFIFLQDAQAGTLTLMVDEAAKTVQHSADNPFFEGQQMSALTRRALAFCQEYQAQALLTGRFVDALVKAELLIENRADIHLASGEKLTLSGFLRIDEAKLQQLPSHILAEWQKQGWLGPIYAHLLSISRWGKLVDAEALAQQGNAA